MSNITVMRSTAPALKNKGQSRLSTMRQGLARRVNETGAISAEYGMTILVAVALALCIFTLITNGAFDGVITTLLKSVLTRATSLVGK